jgi:hypothetical protein
MQNQTKKTLVGAFRLEILAYFSLGQEPKPKPHQKFYPEPYLHQNVAAPQHCTRGKKAMLETEGTGTGNNLFALIANKIAKA